MDWGKKIIMAYSLFVVLMITLTVACFKQKDIFLVSEDYYQQEVNYQERIDKTQNALGLTKNVSIIHDDESKKLKIDLSEESRGAKGTVTFYRPSNPKLDIVFPVNLSVEGTQEIPTEKLQNGLWLIKIEWKKGEQAFYSEQKIQI